MTGPLEEWIERSPGWLERALTLAGILLLAAWTWTYHQGWAFHQAGTKALAAARASASPVTDPRVLGRIEIPRLGISALIAEGAGPRQLGEAVGHISSSAFPGERGNCALAGHRDSFLRGLGKVRKKDLIRIDTAQDTYTYRVEWGSVVAPERVSVLDPTAEPSLTLVTCYPFHMVGPAPERFVVRARLVTSTD